LIVCLTHLATRDPWTRLMPNHFGGDARCWSVVFCWFIDHLFINFYHKISGRSIESWIIWIIQEFKKAILDCLAQPAHPIELDFDEGLAHQQYIIQCPIECWQVLGFLDDTNVRTCRPGSGPVGNRDGSG
jgi:hypothetical protein